MSNTSKAFFAYPSTPQTIPESITTAASEINKSQECHINTWQSLNVTGKVIIDTICRSIEQSDIFMCDITGVNPNVLFELGYAIAHNKRIWTILDTSYSQSTDDFKKLGILSTVGYCEYSNSSDIIANYYRDTPWADKEETIFKMSIEPALNNSPDRKLLYLKNNIDTESSNKLSRLVDSFSLPTIISDPKEAAVETLVWYASKIWNSIGVIVHLSSPKRYGYAIHNARYAFASGLAHGFNKPLLMIAEEGYVTPIDYRDMLKIYKTASECTKFAEKWLKDRSTEYESDKGETNQYSSKVEFSINVRSLNLGEYLAENEEEDLENYFLETNIFKEILEGRHPVVVGRKGSGKTASMLMAARHLKRNKRNLVCVIRPVSYDVQGIVRLSHQLRDNDKKGYFDEVLWKFLIYTELAINLYNELHNRPSKLYDNYESEFVKLYEKNPDIFSVSFSERLENCINQICTDYSDNNLKEFRLAISEIAHDTILKDMRRLFGEILKDRENIAILVDNLDKAWGSGEDIPYLSSFLFGLIRVGNDITKEFSRSDNWRKPIKSSIVIFLRSDIFSRIYKSARERDKIIYKRLSWDDKDALMSILDERMAANNANRDTTFDSLFCNCVNGIPTKDYIYKSILPRPRDLVYFAKAALATAVNRNHDKVLEYDILYAEKEYSRYVFDVIQVENGISLPALENLMSEFIGRDSILTRDVLYEIINQSGLIESMSSYAIQHLVTLSFLGLEVSNNEFRFCNSEDDVEKILRLADRYTEKTHRSPRYKIHNAFHRYLEVEETEL